MGNQMMTSEIISQFYEYTIWLPFNIIGEELRLQSRVFKLFIYREILLEMSLIL